MSSCRWPLFLHTETHAYRVPVFSSETRSLPRGQCERSPRAFLMTAQPRDHLSSRGSRLAGRFAGLHAHVLLFVASRSCCALAPRGSCDSEDKRWTPTHGCGIGVVTSQPHLVNLSRLQACVCPLWFREQSAACADRKGHYGRDVLTIWNGYSVRI